LSGGLYVGCATAAAQQGSPVPSCTCFDHQQMIGLQQFRSRCLHRNAPETVVVTLHRRGLVNVEAAVTCKLTSVQARQPWLCWQSVWAVLPLWGDRCAAGCQVLVHVCRSMWAMLLQCFVQVWQQVCHQTADRVFSTRAIAKLRQCPLVQIDCSCNVHPSACPEPVRHCCSAPPKGVCRLQSQNIHCA
jgi:hypothetical protein